MILQENTSTLKKESIGFFDLFIFLLSLYVIGELVAESLFNLDRELLKLLQKIDFGICLIFLWDFTARFIQAPNKLKFMKWGWIDLLSSIPAWNGFFVGRTLRIFRVLRLIRAYRSFQSLIAHLFKNVPQGTLTSLLIITFFLVLFSSIAVLSFERDVPGSNINNAGDALWWTMTTITTVGYGDHYPVTLEGRLVAVALMVAGAGIFGTFTAVVSSMFVRAPKKAEVPAEITEQLREMRQLLEELKKQRS